MKKLGRLKLNPEKLLSHDELVSFKGGSGSGSTCDNVNIKKHCCKTKWPPYEDYNWTCYAPDVQTCKDGNPISSSATTTCNVVDCQEQCVTYG